MPDHPSILTETLPGGFSFDMVFVEGGSFMMGGDKYDREKPIHEVVLDNFYMGRYPVTQALWKAIMGSDPEKLAFPHPMRPVEGVSWDDCQEFIEKLNAKTSKTYRLPYEAEWEYAARGGKYSKGFTYAGSNNLLEVGWYYDNSQSITQPVGCKRPNELGLFDMSGNVWEWCSDWFGDYPTLPEQNPIGPLSGSYRVLRGGGWNVTSEVSTIAFRNSHTSVFRSTYYGFRVAQD